MKEPKDSSESSSESSKQKRTSKAQRRKLIWSQLRILYESIGNTLTKKELLAIVQKLLNLDDEEVPTDAAFRTQVNRGNWVAGGKKPDVVEKNSKNDDFETKKDGETEQTKSFALICAEKVADMSDGQLDDEEAQMKEKTEKYVKLVKQGRINLRLAHMEQIAKLSEWNDVALEFAMSPIDMTADERELAVSLMRNELGVERLRTIQLGLQNTLLIQAQQAGILGIDYGIDDQEVGNEAKLKEVRQNAAMLFKQQQERYARTRESLAGRGEKIEEEITNGIIEMDGLDDPDFLAGLMNGDPTNRENAEDQFDDGQYKDDDDD